MLVEIVTSIATVFGVLAVIGGIFFVGLIQFVKFVA